MKHHDGRLSRTTVRMVAVSALLLLILAGLLYYWATPSDPDRFTRVGLPGACYDAWTGLAKFGTGLIAVTGGVLALFGAVAVVQPRKWIHAAVPFFGISLFVCAAAATVLFNREWPGWQCRD